MRSHLGLNYCLLLEQRLEPKCSFHCFYVCGFKLAKILALFQLVTRYFHQFLKAVAQMVLQSTSMLATKAKKFEGISFFLVQSKVEFNFCGTLELLGESTSL